jgi:hypothetical protein
LAEAEADGFAKKEGENFRRSGDIFFEGEAGSGEDLFEAGVAGAEPGEVAAGGEDGAGGGDGFGGGGQVHGLGEEGEAEAGAEVFGVEEGRSQFREGRCGLAGGEKDSFLQGVETDGKKQRGGQSDDGGEGEGPEGGFQE